MLFSVFFLQGFLFRDIMGGFISSTVCVCVFLSVVQKAGVKVIVCWV